MPFRKKGAALSANDIDANGTYVFVYDGTYWQAVSGVLAYDAEQYGDECAEGVVTSFRCALETAPEGADAGPFLDKHLLSVYVDGSGEWTVKLKYRTGGGDYTTVTVDTVEAPGWVHASLDLAVYQERIIRCEADSASDVRIKSVTIWEGILGG